jgi:hypothetical protein
MLVGCVVTGLLGFVRSLPPLGLERLVQCHEPLTKSRDQLRNSYVSPSYRLTARLP